MKNKLIQLSVLLFLFFTTQAYANPINKISFIGLNTSSESSLLEILPFKIGQDFSPYASNKIIESLFATGLYENISIVKNENSLEITLKENPNIKYLEIKLNSGSGFSNWLKNEKSHFSNEELNTLATENQLSTGKTFTEKKLEDFISLLESKYFDSGYYNVVITQNTQIDVQNRAGIILSVTQGERANIDLFSISGAEKISEKVLLKLFKIGELICL